MRTPFLLAAAFIAVLGFRSTSFGAEWALTADTPLSYTFNNRSATKPINNTTTGNSPAVLTDRTTSTVSGSKVMLIAPFHVGIGYEDYSAQQKFPVSGCMTCQGPANLRLGIRMIDAMLDIPTRLFNFGLGCGSGTVEVNVALPAGTGGIAVKPPRNVNAEQYFAVLGINLGTRLDVHVGYHQVSVAEATIRDSHGDLSKLQASGDMISAGLRLNF